MYVATNISLPLTGLSVFAQGDFSLINDHSLYGYQIGLSYDLIDSRAVDFNVTLGYRVVKMEFEDLNNLYTDLEFKGAFVGVIAHF
jgi:outer membrane protein